MRTLLVRQLGEMNPEFNDMHLNDTFNGTYEANNTRINLEHTLSIFQTELMLMANTFQCRLHFFKFSILQ